MKTIKNVCDVNSMRWLAGAFGIAILLMFPQCAAAQLMPPNNAVSAASAPAASANGAAKVSEEEEESSKQHKPGSEGVKVHGHWVLQVKNADGTLGERREFDNSLVTDEVLTSGDQYMLAVLSGNITPSDPGIALVTFSDPALATTYKPSTYCPMTNVGGPAGINCYILTTPASLINSYAKAGQFSGTTTNLTIQTQLTAPVAWTLSGNFTVPTGVTTITTVQTLASFCAPKSVVNNAGPPANDLNETLGTHLADVAPSGCTNTAASITPDFAWIAALTSTAIPNASGVPTPLAVTAGQVVTVVVKISFS